MPAVGSPALPEGLSRQASPKRESPGSGIQAQPGRWKPTCGNTLVSERFSASGRSRNTTLKTGSHGYRLPDIVSQEPPREQIILTGLGLGEPAMVRIFPCQSARQPRLRASTDRCRGCSIPPSGTSDASASHAPGSACNRYLVVTSNCLANAAFLLERFSLPIRSTASSSRGVSTVRAARM